MCKEVDIFSSKYQPLQKYKVVVNILSITYDDGLITKEYIAAIYEFKFLLALYFSALEGEHF